MPDTSQTKTVSMSRANLGRPLRVAVILGTDAMTQSQLMARLAKTNRGRLLGRRPLSG